MAEKLQEALNKLDLIEKSLSTLLNKSEGSEVSVDSQEFEKEKLVKTEDKDDIDDDLSKKLLSQGSEKDLYDQAYIFMKDGKYHDAESNFHSFISMFPDSKLVPRSYYWIADINYHNKNYRHAAMYFVKAYAADPKGTKAPISLFKLASALSELKDEEHACLILGKLFRGFPDLVYSLKSQACGLSVKINCEQDGFCT